MIERQRIVAIQTSDAMPPPVVVTSTAEPRSDEKRTGRGRSSSPAEPEAHAKRAEPLPTFEEVVEAFGPALWRLTAGYASDHASREDLHQEILLGVWKALPRFRGESSVATFIFRIGHNRGITHRARRKAREWREVDVEPSIADHRPPADALLQIEERRNALLLAVRALPPTLAQTVMLHLEGLSAREIGEVLGITENNAAVRLTRARNTLRETLSRGPT